MKSQRFKQEEIRTKLKWLMVLRVLIVTILLGASMVLQVGYGKSGGSALAFSYLIISTYFLTILYSLFLNRIRRIVLLAYVQIGADLLFETYLVYLTGGIESPFSPFYMVTTIAASIILGRRGGSITASFASILFGILADLQYFRMLPNMGASTYSNTETLYVLSLNIVAFLTVAYLSGGLAEKLSLTQERLIEKTTGLAELRAFSESVVRSMSSGLLTTGLDGKITSFNRAAEVITGYQFPEVKEKYWWEVFDAPDMRSLINPEKPLIEPIRFDRDCRKNDGAPLLLGITVSPLKNEEAEQIGCVWIFQNLTRIRQMEQEIEEKNRMAAIGEMSAGMAHEIRNPLAALSGSMQVLRSELRLEDEESRHLMEIALKETERLNGIITAFLLYARPAPLNKKRSDINHLVMETLDLLRNRKENPGNVEFRLNLVPGELWAQVDPDQIRQVFWNLSINAIEAMDQGGGFSITTRPVSGNSVRTADSRSWIEVTFSDNGKGISKDDINKIFYPFFTTKDRGSGLGLSVVHRIIEEHRGRTFVNSRPGEGTQFTLLLPVNGSPLSDQMEDVKSKGAIDRG